MGKKGKTLNPTDQYRKAQRKKELKKNKEVRKQTRETGLLRKDITKIQGEISKIEKTATKGGKLDKALKIKKKKLDTELLEVIKLKKELQGNVPTREEYEQAMTTVVPKTKEELEQENLIKYENPELSVYYHPTLNPFGAPPPGAAPMYRAPPPGFHGTALLTSGKKEVLALTAPGAEPVFLPPKPLDPPPLPPKPLEPPPKPLDLPPKPLEPPPPKPLESPIDPELEDIPLPPGADQESLPPLPPTIVSPMLPPPPTASPLLPLPPGQFAGILPAPPMTTFLPPPPNVPFINRTIPVVAPPPSDAPYVYVPPPPQQFLPPPPIPFQPMPPPTFIPSVGQFQPPKHVSLPPTVSAPIPSIPRGGGVEDDFDEVDPTVLIPTSLRVKRDSSKIQNKPNVSLASKKSKPTKDEDYDAFMKDMKELGAL